MYMLPVCMFNNAATIKKWKPPDGGAKGKMIQSPSFSSANMLRMET